MIPFAVRLQAVLNLLYMAWNGCTPEERHFNSTRINEVPELPSWLGRTDRASDRGEHFDILPSWIDHYRNHQDRCSCQGTGQDGHFSAALTRGERSCPPVSLLVLWSRRDLHARLENAGWERAVACASKLDGKFGDCNSWDAALALKFKSFAAPIVSEYKVFGSPGAL